MSEIPTSQPRYGSKTTPRLATPIATLRPNGKQQASVDNAKKAAATGITLVEGFIIFLARREWPPESTQDRVFPEVFRPRHRLGNSPRTGSALTLLVRRPCHRFARLANLETK